MALAEQNFMNVKKLLEKIGRTQDIEYGICEKQSRRVSFYTSTIHFEKAAEIGRLFKEKELKFVA